VWSRRAWWLSGALATCLVVVLAAPGGTPVPPHGSVFPLAGLWDFLAAHPVWASVVTPSPPVADRGGPKRQPPARHGCGVGGAQCRDEGDVDAQIGVGADLMGLPVDAETGDTTKALETSVPGLLSHLSASPKYRDHRSADGQLILMDSVRFDAGRV